MSQLRFLLLFCAISVVAAPIHARDCEALDRLDRAYASYQTLIDALDSADQLNAANVLQFDLLTLNEASVRRALQGTSLTLYQSDIILFLNAAELLSVEATHPGPLRGRLRSLVKDPAIADIGRRLAAYDCRTDTRRATGQVSGQQDGPETRTGVDLLASSRNPLTRALQTLQDNPLLAILSGILIAALIGGLVTGPRLAKALRQRRQGCRRASRVTVAIDIGLTLHGQALSVRTSDISRSGLKVERPAGVAHERGDTVTLSIAGTPFAGRIVWLNELFMGVQLDQPMSRGLFRKLARRARKKEEDAPAAPQTAPATGS